MLSGILTLVQPHSLQGPKLLSKKYEVSQGNKIHTHILTSAFPFPSSFSKIRLLYLRSDFNKTNTAFLTVSLEAKKEPEKHFSGQNYSLLLVSIHFPAFTVHVLTLWKPSSFLLLTRHLWTGRPFTVCRGPHAVQVRLLSAVTEAEVGADRDQGCPAQKLLSDACAPGKPPGREGTGGAASSTPHFPPARPLEFPLNWFNISLVFPLMNELNKSLDMSAFCFCMTVKLLPFLKLSFGYSMAEQIVIETFKEQLGRNIMVNFITIWALLECTYYYLKIWIQFITWNPKSWKGFSPGQQSSD